MGEGGAKWGKITTFVPTNRTNEKEEQTDMRFLGNIEAKTDAKGRVFLPSAMRKVLQGAGEELLVMRKDVHQPCLVLYPESVWNRQMDEARQRLNRWDSREQLLFRQFVMNVEFISLDGNGRFLIDRKSTRLNSSH